MDINNQSIKAFVANIATKDYKQANTSLQQMIEDKLKMRIKETSFAKKIQNKDK